MNVWKFVVCVGLALVLPNKISAQSNEPPRELVQALVKLDAGLARGYKASDPVSANSRSTVLELVPAAAEAKVSFTEKGSRLGSLFGFREDRNNDLQDQGATGSRLRRE